MLIGCFFFSSRRRHTRWPRDWSSDVCSSDLPGRSGPWSLISVITEDQRTAPLLETSDEPPESSLIIALLSGSDEIGRASCRERVEISEGAEEVKDQRGSDAGVPRREQTEVTG